MKKVGISPPAAVHADRALIARLAEVLGFEAVEREFDPADVTLDAWIVTDTTPDHLPAALSSRRPCFVVLPGGRAPQQDKRVRLTRDPALPAVLAGRELQLDEPAPQRALPSLPSAARTLAKHAERPVWAVLGHNAAAHHVTSLPLPALAPGEPLYTLFHQARFFGLLPLLSFLRDICEDPSWEPPPLQACFMFDDPNLHWSSYGHIDFEALALHARSNGYHAASATVPLDSWFVHRRTAELFHRHAEQISLLIHGNDHVNEELARNVRPDECRRSLAQALHRIERLESRTSLPVSRVMAPPHGACSEESLAQMARLGYEAACISRGSLHHYNPRAPWTATIGMRPCDAIRGLPVLPRFRITPHCHNAILVAAVLRQPIIPVGHHQDVAGGFQLLSSLADFIATLGPVRWGSMASIARSHYARRIDAHVLTIRLHTRRADIVVPEGVEQLGVLPPWWSVEPVLCRIDNATELVALDANRPLSVRPGQQVEVHVGAAAEAVRPASAFGLSPWPIVRRLLTESRDRISPLLRARP